MRSLGGSAKTSAFLTAAAGSGLLAIAILACVGEDPQTGGGTSGGPDGALSDTTPGADAGVPRCVSAPPSDWQGPVAVRLETDPSGKVCDPSWSAQVAVAGVGTPGGPTTCAECTCGAAGGATCPAVATLTRTSPTDPTCAEATSTYDAGVGCTDLGGTFGGNLRGLAPTPTPGSCSPDGGAMTARPPAFGQYARVCAPSSSPPSAPECEGQLLVPGFDNPSEWALCVYQQGDVASCPLGSPFKEGRLVVASQFVDDRSCAACGCTTPAGVACSAYTTRVFSTANCTGATVADVAHDGTCGDFVSTRWFRLLNTPTLASQGTCTPTGGSPTGAVTTNERVTLCCLAP